MLGRLSQLCHFEQYIPVLETVLRDIAFLSTVLELYSSISKTVWKEIHVHTSV
jgi:hypothetical protein